MRQFLILGIFLWAALLTLFLEEGKGHSSAFCYCLTEYFIKGKWFGGFSFVGVWKRDEFNTVNWPIIQIYTRKRGIEVVTNVCTALWTVWVQKI